MKKTVAVLLTKESYDKVLDISAIKRLKKFANVRIKIIKKRSEKSSAKLLRNATGLISSWGTSRLTKDILDGAPDLRIVAHAAGSVRPIVSDEVWKRKIIVTSSAPAIAVSVAEFTLGMIITGLIRAYSLAKETSKGGWRCEHIPSKGLYGVIIGIVGAGFVGRYVMKLLKHFNVTVFLYDPFVTNQEAAKLGVNKVSLKKLMRSSDVVTLHAPNIPATHHIISKGMLSLMKKGAVLINTARGRLIDEKALTEKVKKGDIFACLDVTDPEPPAKGLFLRKCENVILTPHIAGSGAYRRVGAQAVTELERFFSGKRPLARITEKKLEIMA